MTEKTIAARLKQLNTTGVAGKFSPVAIFKSDRPKKDEDRVHAKLAKKKLDKEHFQVGPVEAALKSYRALSNRLPIFFDKEVEATFHLKLEEAKIQMKLRLKGVKGSLG